MGRKTRSKSKADKGALEWSNDNALLLEERSCNDIIVSKAEETPAVSSGKLKKKEVTKKSSKNSTKSSKKLPTPHTTDADTNATSKVETCDDFTDVEEEQVNDALRAAETRLKNLKQKNLRL